MNSTPEQTFSAEESLRVIQSMINKAKHDTSVRTPYFLLWGWSAFAACIGQFVLNVFLRYEHHYLVWLITIPCIFIHIYFARNESKKNRVRTYVSSSMRQLWLGMGISFFVLSMIFVKLGWFNCYPFFILLYGLGAFVSGKFLQFNALVIGGIICWCLAAVAIWFSFDYQNLFAAAALLFSHIIPGHLIRNAHSSPSIP